MLLEKGDFQIQVMMINYQIWHLIDMECIEL